MGEEVQSSNNNKTLTATSLQKGMKTVRCRWVNAIKTDTDGKEKYKARLPRAAAR